MKEEYYKVEEQDIDNVCDNLQCIHYDLDDPGGNNCTLLFALSEEGCDSMLKSVPSPGAA